MTLWNVSEASFSRVDCRPRVGDLPCEYRMGFELAANSLFLAFSFGISVGINRWHEIVNGYYFTSNL